MARSIGAAWAVVFFGWGLLGAPGAPAATAGDLGVPDGVSFEAFPNTETREVFLFVRFAEEREGEVVVTVRDEERNAVATLRDVLESGSAMLWWNGLAPDGGPVPGGDFTAELVAGDHEGTTGFALPVTPNER